MENEERADEKINKVERLKGREKERFDRDAEMNSKAFCWA